MRPIRIVFFLTIMSGFIYLANLVVYEALAAMFFITSPFELVLLGSALGVLSASFVAATFLGMRYYHLFTRLYYLVSAVWIGFLVYLFFASVIYGLVVLFVGTQSVVGQILIAGAVLVGIYGVLHARNIHIKEVTVSLPHLPSSWQGKKAIWVSDLHLGQIHGPAFARRVVSKVNTIPHDIIFIGGDLFDGTGAPDIRELAAPLKNFAAPLGTYFITGNHEEYGDRNRFVEVIKSMGIRVLLDEMVEIDGLQLVGVDYHNASDAEQFKNILSKISPDKTKPSILLKHEPKDLDVASAAGISLQISGHTHRAQLWPLEYVAQLTYKGYAYGLRTFKDMQVFTSSGTGTWGPPLRVGTNCEIVVFTFVPELKSKVPELTA
jgi:predicted MPP superfamily phosphohydrolase